MMFEIFIQFEKLFAEYFKGELIKFTLALQQKLFILQILI